MTSMMLIIGGTGFIGREVVAEALRAGMTVRALARSAEAEQALSAAGADPFRAEVTDPASWQHHAQGADVIVDLVQPKFPRRLGQAAVKKISGQRQQVTSSVLDAIGGLPEADRPLLFFISGADDLEPDGERRISERSPLRSDPEGFSQIGIPVRRLIEAAGVDAVFLYFGVMVYGPGKVFAEVYVEGLKKRRAPILGRGDNRLPLVHVTDAARAVVHLAALPHGETAGRTFIACDGADTTQRELLETTAELMNAKPPRSVPPAVARLAAGGAAVETMTLDARAEPSALLQTGFSFRFPSHREGVPDTLAKLGLGS